MAERYVPREQYYGREHEFDVFGKFKETPGYREALKRMVAGQEKPYVPFRQSVELVERFSGEDPLHPTQEFLRDLRLEVIDKLGLDEDEVRAYTAVDTPLDRLHGADAFLAIKPRRAKRETVVTLDATLLDAKLTGQQASKADVLVGDVPRPESDRYLDSVERYAIQVARAYEEKQDIRP